jgi:hypothetical protein
MLKDFEDLHKYGKDNVDATMKVWGQVSKGVQAIAAETADYSKKSFEEGSAALQKLLGAKSLENAIEIQTAYAKTAYDGFVAHAARMGEFYVNLAKETSRSFENFVPQAPAAKPTENFVPQAPAAKPTENFVPQAPAAKPTENFVPQAPAAKPTENFVPQAPAATPTENFVPQAATPKATTPKAPATRSPRPRNKPPPTSPDSETTTRNLMGKWPGLLKELAPGRNAAGYKVGDRQVGPARAAVSASSGLGHSFAGDRRRS